MIKVCAVKCPHIEILIMRHHFGVLDRKGLEYFEVYGLLLRFKIH